MRGQNQETVLINDQSYSYLKGSFFFIVNYNGARRGNFIRIEVHFLFYIVFSWFLIMGCEFWLNFHMVKPRNMAKNDTIDENTEE